MALGSRKTAAGSKTTETIRRLEGLRKDATRPVAFRLDPRLYDRIVAVADERGLKPAQLVKSWVLERMRNEGLR